MTKPSRANASRELTTVYGKISSDLAAQLDKLAAARRWSRAQMVAYCIEHFIGEYEDDAPPSADATPRRSKGV